MSLHLYNSLSRNKDRFDPMNANRVTMYVCGPTVYNFAHIGNARPAVVFDVLFRLLRHIYGEEAVIYARNITDIDDKIIVKCAQTERSLENLTQYYADIYNADMAALNVLRPTIEPWATQHIDEMLAMIGRLVEKGHAYTTPLGVYFSVKSQADYGKLSRRKQDDNQAGARVEVASDKRDPADFALWKFTDPSEKDALAGSVWQSQWGEGRPGWHIECSAMAAKYLGKTIDIHGGGVDLRFPHHENEIAQSEACHSAPMANFWLHNGFLNMSGEKMSKSLGNVKLVHDLIKCHKGEVIRYALLSGHYRAELDWNPALLEQANTTLNRLYAALGRVWDCDPDPDAHASGVLTPLLDDLNTPGALAGLAQIANAANIAAENGDARAMAKAKTQFLQARDWLGLLTQNPVTWQKGLDSDDNAKVEALIALRQEARQAKNYAEADRIRDVLAAQGIEIMDKDGQTGWRRL